MPSTDPQTSTTVGPDTSSEPAQLLAEMDHTCTVHARGSSLEELTGKLFQLMRKKIFAEIGRPVIQMDTKEVYFDEFEREETTEHYMLFFWPRTKVTYEATARIVVHVKYLNLNERD